MSARERRCPQAAAGDRATRNADRVGFGLAALAAVVLAAGVYQLAEFIAHTWPGFHP